MVDLQNIMWIRRHVTLVYPISSTVCISRTTQSRSELSTDLTGVNVEVGWILFYFGKPFTKVRVLCIIFSHISCMTHLTKLFNFRWFGTYVQTLLYLGYEQSYKGSRVQWNSSPCEWCSAWTTKYLFVCCWNLLFEGKSVSWIFVILTILFVFRRSYIGYSQLQYIRTNLLRNISLE